MRPILVAVMCALAFACNTSQSSPPADAALVLGGDSAQGSPHDLSTGNDMAVSLLYPCAAPPSKRTLCMAASDCVFVASGCYCGAQPVKAVAQAYADTAQACESQAASACALGCPNSPGVIADDGQSAASQAQLSLRCDRGPGDAIGDCYTFVP